MSKFRYIIFPENTYLISIQDSDGNDFEVEILGKDIESQIKNNYVLESFTKKLDNAEDE